MVDKVTDATFDQDVLKASGPVVVDFWAEWCGPCRMISPALEEISNSLNGKVKIVKLNVDENPAITTKYGIMSIPTLMPPARSAPRPSRSSNSGSPARCSLRFSRHRRRFRIPACAGT
jgi:thioredoxin 1